MFKLSLELLSSGTSPVIFPLLFFGVGFGVKVVLFKYNIWILSR